MNFMTSLKNGLFYQNPVFVQLIGMCPALAVSTTLENALGMGISATAVLICSNMVISALRKFIPSKIRIAAYITIIAGFVTVIDLLIKAYIPSLSESLGLFIPLIVVNCIILGRAESFASKNAVLPSAIDGLTMGLGFTFALSILGTIREILSNGTLLGFNVMWESFEPITILRLPAGGFLILGLVVAVIQKIMKKGGNK